MAYSRRYSRLFVTLKQERPDYCLNFRQAMGRCIIEIRNNKGKLLVYAQGLKPKVLYKIYMISCEKEYSLGVPVESIDIDSSGKGEIKCEFEPDNVFGTGYSIEDFKVIVLMVQGQNEIVAPMAGYIDNIVMWKNNFKYFSNVNTNDKNSFGSKQAVNDIILNENITEESTQEKNDKIDETETKEEKIQPENIDIKEESSIKQKAETETKEEKIQPENIDIKEESSIKQKAETETKEEKIQPENIDIKEENTIKQKAETETKEEKIQPENIDIKEEGSIKQKAATETKEEKIQSENTDIKEESSIKQIAETETKEEKIQSKNTDIKEESSIKQTAETETKEEKIQPENIDIKEENTIKQKAATETKEEKIQPENIDVKEENTIKQKAATKGKEKSIQLEKERKEEEIQQEDIDIGEMKNNEKNKENEIKGSSSKIDLQNKVATSQDFYSDEEGIEIKSNEDKVKEEKQINDSFKSIIGKFKKEFDELKYYTFMTEEEAEKQKVKYDNVNESVFKDLDYMFENNLEMKPFEIQNKDVIWIRVNIKELSAIPGQLWKYINNPFINCSYKKYKHLLLGKYEDDNKLYYIFAVPGVYSPNYKLEASIQGFNQFKCCENKKPSKDDYGYWILNVKDNE